MNRSILRLVIAAQLFTLTVLLLMPLIVHALGTLLGKIAYAVVVLISVALAIALRYALFDA